MKPRQVNMPGLRGWRLVWVWLAGTRTLAPRADQPRVEGPNSPMRYSHMEPGTRKGETIFELCSNDPRVLATQQICKHSQFKPSASCLGAQFMPGASTQSVTATARSQPQARFDNVELYPAKLRNSDSNQLQHAQVILSSMRAQEVLSRRSRP
jgi:hypothetical protein